MKQAKRFDAWYIWQQVLTTSLSRRLLMFICLDFADFIYAFHTHSHLLRSQGLKLHVFGIASICEPQAEWKTVGVFLTQSLPRK